MPVAATCPECSRDIPADAPHGVCPLCLLGLAASVETETSAELTTGCRTPGPAAGPITKPDDTATQELSGPHAGRTSAPPREFAGYELLEEIGRGGMGIVYRAVQQRVGRVVALKVIRGGASVDERLRQRFGAEAKALGRLRHPHIVQVYDVGDVDGSPYFSMEYVEGGSLARRLKEQGSLPVAGAAQIVETLAGAVDAAHQAGILHRDLKPSNVLLGADGAPRLSDFGLAKLLETGEDYTPSGTVLGTPSYMAPEQAAGNADAVGPRTDVYSLGIILYELLTGATPFKSDSHADTVQKVLTAQPEPPSRRRPDVPAGLEAVCLRCLVKDPSRRYATAAELADDLARWRRGEPTLARPPRLPERVWRRVRRRPYAAGAALALLAAAAVAVFAPRPGEPLREFERELAAGRPVTLVGEAGPPRWYRWPRFEGRFREPRFRDGAFCFEGNRQTYLELLPDPIAARYRFSTEVRHDERFDLRVGTFVGIYFGCEHFEFPDGRILHRGMRLTFCDWNDHPPGAKPQMPPAKPQAPLPVQVKLEDFLRTQVKGQRELRTGATHGTLSFERGNGKMPFRKLIVDVGPDSLMAFWAESPDAGLRPLTGLPLARDDLRRLTQGQQAQLANSHGPDFADVVLGPWDPRRGLGLYLDNGAVSYRNVIVQPLP